MSLRNGHLLNLLAQLEHASYFFARSMPLNHQIRELTVNPELSLSSTSSDSSVFPAKFFFEGNATLHEPKALSSRISRALDEVLEISPSILPISRSK
jgi:hypothetical protein